MADIMRECQQSNWPSIFTYRSARQAQYYCSKSCFIWNNYSKVNEIWWLTPLLCWNKLCLCSFGFVPVTIRTACNFKDISTTSFSHFHVIFIATYDTFDMVLHLTCQLELPDQNNAISCF